MSDEDDVCDCGHPNIQHEPAARVGRAWFAVDLAEKYGEAAMVFHYCAECRDGCYVVAVLEPRLTEAGEG